MTVPGSENAVSSFLIRSRLYHPLVNSSSGGGLSPSGEDSAKLEWVGSLLSSHLPALLASIHHRPFRFILMRIFLVIDSTMRHVDSARAASLSSSFGIYWQSMPNSSLNIVQFSHTYDHTPSLSILIRQMI